MIYDKTKNFVIKSNFYNGFRFIINIFILEVDFLVVIVTARLTQQEKSKMTLRICKAYLVDQAGQHKLLQKSLLT
jgi:hypothetical protein